MADSIYQVSPSENSALCQGEILSGLIRFCVRVETIQDSQPTFSPVHHSFVIVLTQTCDLRQDFSSRPDGKSQLDDILFCQVPTAEELKKATPGMNSTIWDPVRKNKNERYHFLEKIPAESDRLGQGIAELGIDFKRNFTLPTEEVYQRIALKQIQRRTLLRNPYLEHLSSRFSYFLGRVALPRDHVSE